MDISLPAARAVETAAAEIRKPSAEPTSEQNETSNSSDKIRSFINAGLGFLSNASNETLGACAIGLCFLTYFVLGRVGLVLIGAVGGVVLHATWEDTHDDRDGTENELQKRRSRRKELGVEVAKRVLNWRDRRRGSENREEDEDVKVEASVATRPLDYSEFKPATGAALTALTEAVVRDYVKYVQSILHCY